MKCYQKHYSALLLREGRFYTEDWSSLQKINHVARRGFQTTWAITLLCYKHCWSVHICRLWFQGGVGEKNKQVLVSMQMKKYSFQNPLIPYQPGQILSLCVVIATEAWSTHWLSLHFYLLKHFLFYLKLWSDKFISSRITKEVRLFIYWSL